MGLEILLYIYLAGFVGTSGYGVYQCQKPVRVITKNECRTLAVVKGAVWPAVIVEKARRKL